MSEQPLKSRTIKTIPQKETSKEGLPAIDSAMLLTQYTTVITRLDNIEQRLDYLIAQPQIKPKLEAPVPSQKMEKSLGVWEQTPQEKKGQPKPVKKKSGKGIIILTIFFGLLLIIAIGLFLQSEGWVFFWTQ